MTHAGPARLSLATLGAVRPGVARPAYDPARLAVGIVHLGLGAFHRAHQAAITDALLARDPRWGICGVSMQTPRATATLAGQDGLYTLLVKDAAGVRARIVGAIRATAFAPADPAALVARIADPAVHVVTLTVTEKGYCHEPASGRLVTAHPDVAHDLAHPSVPRSVPGLLAAALEARIARGAGPLNIVCCDNLPHNGRVLAGLVRSYAEARGGGLAARLDDVAAFPCTMVDRIVPATTPADIAEAEALTGLADAAPVVAEPFLQWAIEDRFLAPRPRWEDAGAEIVADVAPFETMKLRLLNGSHSTLAYLGFLAGHATIAQAASDPRFASLIERQMREEVLPVLAAPPGTDLASYCRTLGERFRNPVLPHRTSQVAMDGSQKLPQRWLATVRERLALGLPVRHLALSVAGWMRYATGIDEQGGTIAMSDPLAPHYAAVAAEAGRDPARLAAGFLAIAPIFGNDLPAARPFVTAVERSLASLLERGAGATVDDHVHAG